MTNTLTKYDFFFCYSKTMRNYLMDNGLKFVLSALSTQTNDQFWLFQKSDELQFLLDAYIKFDHN